MADEKLDLSVMIEKILSNLSIGDPNKAIANNLFGFNYRTKNTPLPRPKSSIGYYFFTRPMLNLSTYNIGNCPDLFSLMTSEEKSYQRYVRNMLSPRLHLEGIKSPFVNERNAFIPLLTNSALSVSGWPDLELPTYTSAAGLYGEQTSHVDGVPNRYNVFDLTANFMNTRGHPLLYLFYIWYYYQTNLIQETVMPYVSMILENEMDYNTRIYRMVLDQRQRYVEIIAATGASFPINVPIGTFLDYNSEKPFLDGVNEIPIRFRCCGFIFGSDRLKLEFNQTQALFNPDIAALIEHDFTSKDMEPIKRELPDKAYAITNANLVKVPHNILHATQGSVFNNPHYNLNYKAYPYINLVTNELEWWVEKDIFEHVFEMKIIT